MLNKYSKHRKISNVWLRDMIINKNLRRARNNPNHIKSKDRECREKYLRECIDDITSV